MCLGLDYLILASGGYALVSGMEFYEVVGFALRGGYIEGYTPSTFLMGSALTGSIGFVFDKRQKILAEQVNQSEFKPAGSSFLSSIVTTLIVSISINKNKPYSTISTPIP